MWWPSGTWWSGRLQSRAGPVSAPCSSPGSRQFKLSLRSWGTFPPWGGTQNHRWPLVSKIWKPSKNHWKQWSGGWKSLNGDGWMTPKPLKNHRVQWSVIKKVVNGDGQRGAKPSKNHWCQWFSREKTIVSHRSQKMTIVHLYLHEVSITLFDFFSSSNYIVCNFWYVLNCFHQSQSAQNNIEKSSGSDISISRGGCRLSLFPLMNLVSPASLISHVGLAG